MDLFDITDDPFAFVSNKRQLKDKALRFFKNNPPIEYYDAWMFDRCFYEWMRDHASRNLMKCESRLADETTHPAYYPGLEFQAGIYRMRHDFAVDYLKLLDGQQRYADSPFLNKLAGL